MQITRAGEYAVLGLLHLARHEPGRTVMIEEVSLQEKIPKSFLAKIFQTLARAGIVHSHRGAHGGFSLARNAGEISVLEVIEAVEGRIAFQRCLQERPACEHMEGCALCGLWERAQDQVKEVFSKTSLASLAKQKSAQAESVSALPRQTR